MMPSEWGDSFIFSVFKGKGKAIERGNYHRLKLTEHVLRMVEQIREVIIWDVVTVADMHGRGTTDAIFNLRTILEKHIRKNCNLYFVLVDLEKAFNRVPRKVLWLALWKVDIPE